MGLRASRTAFVFKQAAGGPAEAPPRTRSHEAVPSCGGVLALGDAEGVEAVADVARFGLELLEVIEQGVALREPRCGRASFDAAAQQPRTVGGVLGRHRASRAQSSWATSTVAMAASLSSGAMGRAQTRQRADAGAVTALEVTMAALSVRSETMVPEGGCEPV